LSLSLPAKGPDRLEESAADPLEAYGPAAKRRKRTVVCGDRSGASPAGTGKQDPHFAYNKTIPYRFVLVKNAPMP